MKKLLALALSLTGESKVLMLAPYDNERAQMLMAWNRAKKLPVNVPVFDYNRNV